MFHDLKNAFRQIWKSPGYTLVVVLTLAFGIAVNTQIFAIVSGFFLQPMPVREPERLTTIIGRSNIIPLPHQLSFGDYQELRSGSKALTDHVAFTFVVTHVSAPGKPPVRAWMQGVTPDAFGKLGVRPFLGRMLETADGELPPGRPVTVLTHRFWKTQFGGDPSILGQTVLINSQSFVVVGIAPPEFEGFSWALTAAGFVPTGAMPLLRNDGDAIFKYRGMLMWRVLAYLPPGGDLAKANAELQVFAQRFAKENPESHRNVRLQSVLEMRARPDPTMSDFTVVFAALFAGLVALVLFIACANVANLMTTRSLAREPEFVLRAALGGTRWQLMRQLLVESVVLAALAGVAGGFIAWMADGILRGVMPGGDLTVREVTVNAWHLIAFTTVISLLAGVGAGLIPAWRASRLNLQDGLKKATRQAGSSRHLARDFLVISQVALSCVVLIASALFLRGLHTAHEQSLGLRPERLLTASFDLNLQGYDQTRGMQFQRDLLQRVRALPGVEGATVSQHVPFNYTPILRQHYPVNPTVELEGGSSTVMLSAVDPSYLKTAGIPVLRGRDLLASDDENAPKVAVINEAMAQAFWPGRNPIGQHFRRDWEGGPPIEVVGVVATGKYLMLTEAPRPFYYTPMAQGYDMPATLLVRTKGDPHLVAGDVRELFRSLDPHLPIYSVTTFDEHMAGSVFALMPLRFGSWLAGVQGAIGLLLAVMGLYAVVSYEVTRRTRDIGVRMALGATEKDVFRLVSGNGLRLTLYGLAGGLVLAVLLSLGLSRILFGVSPVDPIAFPVVIALLVATTYAACLIPARRATRVDPVEALRAE